MDDSAIRGLTQFQEHFAVIPCRLKDLRRQQGRYFQTFGFQTKYADFAESLKANMRVLA